MNKTSVGSSDKQILGTHEGSLNSRMKEMVDLSRQEGIYAVGGR